MKIKERIEEMLKKDEFDRILWSLENYKRCYRHGTYKYNFITARIEIKRVKWDKDLCEYAIETDASWIPLVSNLKSREVLRDMLYQ